MMKIQHCERHNLHYFGSYCEPCMKEKAHRRASLEAMQHIADPERFMADVRAAMSVMERASRVLMHEGYESPSRALDETIAALKSSGGLE